MRKIFLIAAGMLAMSVMAAHADKYAAYAAGKTETGAETHINSSGALGASQQDANSKALHKCTDSQVTCHIVYTFSHGACGYISVGKVGWGTGKTASGALGQCVSNHGVQCAKPNGGCTTK